MWCQWVHRGDCQRQLPMAAASADQWLRPLCCPTVTASHTSPPGYPAIQIHKFNTYDNCEGILKYLCLWDEYIVENINSTKIIFIYKRYDKNNYLSNQIIFLKVYMLHYMLCNFTVWTSFKVSRKIKSTVLNLPLFRFNTHQCVSPQQP